jgi:multiple antibiotic resistance protein
MKELALYVVNTFVAVFVIVDPFALVPVYLTLTERFTAAERRHIKSKAVLIAASMLLFFSFTGLRLFNFFGFTLPAFQIAGGILLLLLGVEQLAAKRVPVKKDEQAESLEKDDISIFPFATPLLAGPGAISTVVLFSAEAPDAAHRTAVLVAIAAVMVVCLGILTIAPLIQRVLGKIGINLLTRVMGIILTAIAVQFIITGVKGAISAP